MAQRTIASFFKAPIAKPAAPVATVHNTLPTGSFARAVLLSGVDAPTGGLARTNPHPVLLRVMELAQLPNHYRSRVKECFVTAAAYGDLSTKAQAAGYIVLFTPIVRLSTVWASRSFTQS